MPQGKLPDGRVERRTDYPIDTSVIALVDSRRQHSLRYNQGVFNRLQSYYSDYRGYWQGRTSQFRNQVTLPLIFAMIQSGVARLVQGAFSTFPIVDFEGYAPEDEARAKKNAYLVSAQMRDIDIISRAYDFFLQASICGTGVMRYGWKRTVRRNRITQPEEIAPGFSIPVVREYDAEIFNGPTAHVVDRLDFWQQPVKSRIDEMTWVIHRYWADLEDLMEDSSQEYPDGQQPYFDLAAVKQLYNMPLEGAAQSEFVARKSTYRNEYDYQARQQERFAKPVEIWEMHGLVPRAFARDGIRHRCIAIGNGRVVLKNREGPMPNQQKPFISFSPMGDPYSFDGVGKAEIAHGGQVTVNRITNQKLDALDQLIDPMFIASSSAGINTQNLFTRAGRIILVDGAADDSNIRALTPNMQGLQAAFQEIGFLWQFMQLGTGETESLLGVGGGNRETARGFLGRQENAMNRLSFEQMLADVQVVEPLADAFRGMDRYLLPKPHELKILGSLAITDPTTGLPYPPESLTVDYDDLAPDYRARAVGSRLAVGKNVRIQNALTMAQIFSANPALLQLMNWSNSAGQVSDLMGFDPNKMLVRQQVPQVNLQALMGGGTTDRFASTNQPLDQLSPQSLGGQPGNPLQLAGMTG